MPRLFTGLEVPANIADQLARLRGGLPGGRFIEPSDYHITLRFIGDVGGPMGHEIVDMLRIVRRKSFSLKLSELRSFGRDAPHAVVATLATSPELIELQAEHDRIMQRLRLAPDKRKFTPHITLARLKNTPPQSVGEWIVTRSPLSSAPFPVTRFVLYSSKDSIGGGPYLVEEGYALMAT